MPKPEATKEEKEKEEQARLEQEKQDEKVGFIPLAEEAEEPEEAEEEVVEEEPEKPEGAKPEAKPEEEEVPAFKLEPLVQAEVSPVKEGDPEAIEIVHHGQVHRLTKEKIVELAQKGFDYEFKVGPHGKLVRMIESDPELAQLIQAHWEKKTQGPEEKPAGEVPALEIKPMDDYDSEVDWLKGNLEPIIKLVSSMTQEREAPPAAATTQQLPPIATMLMGRDPTNFNLVMGKLPEYVRRLTVGDYQRVDSDPAALCQLYDFVKDQELKKLANPAGRGTPQPLNKPSFKVRSGGGEAPRQGDDVNYAWKLSNDEFEKELARAKGYV